MTDRALQARTREARERPFILGILAMENVMASGIAVPLDALLVAQRLAVLRNPGTPLRLETAVIGARGAGHVAAAGGRSVEVLAADSVPLDALLVPGCMYDHSGDLARRLDGLKAERDLLRTLHLRGVPLAGACSGTFLLAETGLLDGRRATTSWWLDAAFRRRYPQVRLEVEQTLIEDGPFTTTGATTAIMSYVLRWLSQVADEGLAQQTARMMLLDSDRPSQAPYISQALRERPRHSLSERAERFLRHELHRDISVTALAEHCRTSERSLLRHFRTHYGITPLAHIQHLRVERAKAMLETTQLSFDEIVERCGYRDVSSFRKLFKRATTLTPAGYRERFRLRPH